MRLEVALRDYTPCAQQGVTVNMYYTLPTGFSALDVTLAERAHTSSITSGPFSKSFAPVVLKLHLTDRTQII